MKIDNNLKPVPPAQSSAKASAPKAEATAAPKAQQESVQISPFSAHMQAVESSMTSSSVVNFDKVNQIKQAISEGRFQINPEAISEKLINSVKDLLQANQKNA